MKVIVSDTTSLIALEGLATLDLLGKLFQQVVIPEVVFNELVAGSQTIAHQIQTLACIEIVQIPSSEQLHHLLLIIDQGEAEAITLALEKQLPILIDERKGRSIAQQKGLIVIGFLGILVLATQRAVLTNHEAKTLLEQAIKNGFQLSEKLHQQIIPVFNLQ